jgi:hypothetical protein
MSIAPEVRAVIRQFVRRTKHSFQLQQSHQPERDERPHDSRRNGSLIFDVDAALNRLDGVRDFEDSARAFSG